MRYTKYLVIFHFSLSWWQISKACYSSDNKRVQAYIFGTYEPSKLFLNLYSFIIERVTYTYSLIIEWIKNKISLNKMWRANSNRLFLFCLSSENICIGPEYNRVVPKKKEGTKGGFDKCTIASPYFITNISWYFLYY